jgi:hypothetical protein
MRSTGQARRITLPAYLQGRLETGAWLQAIAGDNWTLLYSVADIDFRVWSVAWGLQAMEHRELLSGPVRLHVLHHAAEGEPLRQPDDRGVGAALLQDQSGHTLSDVACAGAQRYLTSRIVKRGGSQRQIL